MSLPTDVLYGSAMFEKFLNFAIRRLLFARSQYEIFSRQATVFTPKGEVSAGNINNYGCSKLFIVQMLYKTLVKDRQTNMFFSSLGGSRYLVTESNKSQYHLDISKPRICSCGVPSFGVSCVHR